MSDIVYSTVGNTTKRLKDMGDGTYAEIVSTATLTAQSWTATTAFNAQTYTDVEVQVIGTPTTAYIFQDSFDGTNFSDCLALDRTGTPLSSITAAGRYRLFGSCYLIARQGAGSTILIRAGN